MKLKYTVATGSSFVATLGDNTVTATAVDGKAVLDCKEVGTWHIKATSPDGVVKEWDQFVPYGGLVKEYYPFAAPTASLTPTSGISYTNGISDLSPQYLSLCGNAISNNSAITKTTSEVYLDGYDNRKISVGDAINIEVSGAQYEFVVIGFNHDQLTSSIAYGVQTATNMAGITLQMRSCLNDKYPMNSSSTNVGGWASCSMRTSTMVSLKESMTDAWQNVLKTVNKLTSAGNKISTINTTEDELFLLSEIEIFGNTPASFAGEGTQYAYYAAGNSRIKTVNGTASIWRQRSPYKTVSVDFCTVNASGGGSGNGAGEAHGVPFALCI